MGGVLLGISTADCGSPVDDTKRWVWGKSPSNTDNSEGESLRDYIDDGGISKRVSLRIIISDDSLYTILTWEDIRQSTYIRHNMNKKKDYYTDTTSKLVI